MGKPTAADLRLGLATAPVLFAAQKHLELNPMIMRRFSEEGDVGRARELVAQVSQSDEQYIYAFYLICIVGNPQLITLNTSHLGQLSENSFLWKKDVNSCQSKLYFDIVNFLLWDEKAKQKNGSSYNLQGNPLLI